MSGQFFICAFDNLGFLKFAWHLRGLVRVHNGLQVCLSAMLKFAWVLGKPSWFNCS